MKPVNFFDRNPAIDVPPSSQDFNKSSLLSEMHHQVRKYVMAYSSERHLLSIRLNSQQQRARSMRKELLAVTHQAASCKLASMYFDSQIVFVVKLQVVCPGCPLLLTPADAWGCLGDVSVGPDLRQPLPISWITLSGCFILNTLTVSLHAFRLSSALPNNRLIVIYANGVRSGRPATVERDLEDETRLLHASWG